MVSFDPFALWQAGPYFHVEKPDILMKLVFGVDLTSALNASVSGGLEKAI